MSATACFPATGRSTHWPRERFRPFDRRTFGFLAASPAGSFGLAAVIPPGSYSGQPLQQFGASTERRTTAGS